MTDQETMSALNAFSHQWAIESENGNSHVKLTGTVPVYVRYGWNNTKQYNFMLWHKLPYIDYYAEKQYKEKNPEPQGVGVLTDKKISAWVDYLTRLYTHLTQESDTRVQKVKDFLEQAKTLGARVREPEHNKGAYSGNIHKNGIEYSFEIDNRSGYISQKVALHYAVPNTINAFQQLSDNKFVPDEQYK